MNPHSIRVLKLGHKALMGGPVLYSHLGSDADSGLGIARARRCNRAIRKMPVVLVPANWDGNGLKSGDICIDIEPDVVPEGVLVLKGTRDPETGTTYSSTELVGETYRCPDSYPLRPMVELINVHDAFGDPYLEKYPFVGLELRMFLNETGFLTFYRAARIDMNDKEFLEFFDMFLDGFVIHREHVVTGGFKPMPNMLTLDQCLAIEAWRRIKGLSREDAKPVFRKGEWTGELSNGDVVTEYPQDTDSLFAQTMQLASKEEQRIMQPLIQLMAGYVQNRANPFKVMRQTQAYAKNREMIQFLGDTCLAAAFEGVRHSAVKAIEKASDESRSKSHFFHNMRVLEFAAVLYKGFHRNRTRADEAIALIEAGDPRLRWSENRQVVEIDNINNHRLTDVLANRYGVRAVVKKDGNRLLIRRADGEKLIRMDHESIIQIIRESGELCPTFRMALWFIHKSGFLVANGTKKTGAPLQPSMVDPWKLVLALEALCNAHPRKQAA